MAPSCSSCFVLAYFSVTIVICLLTRQTEGRVVRIKRQDCTDGTHEQGPCCNCAPGQKLKTPCTNLSQTVCDLCEAGKEYQSHANYLETCEPCTSCSQTNANLEVDRPCTPYNNTVCKCQENHYCSSGTQPCKICEPCQVCGSEGVKKACTATTNTICNGSNATAITLGILIPIAVAVVGGVGFYIWKKKQKKESKTISNGRKDPTEVEAFIGVSLQRHIPAIAEITGWKDMRNLAMQSEMSNSIATCRDNYPNDCLERTIHLLETWVEKESRNASQMLIEYLQQNNRNAKAEKVKEILADANNSANNTV